MTRTVHDNHGVAHIWAQNAYPEGRSHNGQFYFEGPALYSYGAHYLAGFIMPDGVAFLNADSTSVTTSRHVSLAASATRHRRCYYVPNLTKLDSSLRLIAHLGGDDNAFPHDIETRAARAIVRREVRAWAVETLGKRGQELRADAFAYLMRAAGLARSIPAIDREIHKHREARKAQQEREANEEMRSTVDAIARRTPSEVRAECAAIIAARQYGREDLEKRSRVYFRAWKWAKGRKGYMAKARAIKANRDTLRAVLHDSERMRRRATGRAMVRRAIAQLRNPSPHNFLEYYGNRRGDYWGVIWNADCKHEDPEIEYGERSLIAEYVALANIKESTWTPAARMLGDDLDSALHDARDHFQRVHRIRTERAGIVQERRARERVERERAEREAWLNGESVYFHGRDEHGGAYLRAVNVERDSAGTITGGELQTSQGARVPLTHAIRAFKFLKWCRETGTAWQANGQRIRVGHYTLDRVEPNGDFRAGCHFIRWQAVVSVAESLGLLDIAGSREATESKDSV